MQKRLCLLLLAAALAVPSPARSDCFSIIAGRKATADGSVLFAHNEDDGIHYVSRMQRIERAMHTPGEWVVLANGGRIPQAEVTLACWLLEMPGLSYSDALLNECGVAVATDYCGSREDKPSITDGGIGKGLRHIVAQRARTAREGVILAGKLVEQFGYVDSGRSMMICDSREGWVMGIVRGKHWVAARVPDDRVMAVSNTYSIREVNLADSANFLGSPDLVEYAVQRGWYDPKQGPFDFEAAYAGREDRENPVNTHRQWSALNLLSKSTVPLPERERLPFTVRPKTPVKVEHLIAILRNHYEGTPYASGEPNPHQGKVVPVCRTDTNSSSVFQLRAGMPAGIGSIWWYCLWRPCSSPFLPLYLGLPNAPEQLYFEVEADAQPTEIYNTLGPDKAYRVFGDLAARVFADYPSGIGPVQNRWRELEQESFRMQPLMENLALKTWKQDPKLATVILDRFCRGALSRAMQEARNMRGDTEK